MTDVQMCRAFTLLILYLVMEKAVWSVKHLLLWLALFSVWVSQEVLRTHSYEISFLQIL